MYDLHVADTRRQEGGTARRDCLVLYDDRRLLAVGRPADRYLWKFVSGFRLDGACTLTDAPQPIDTAEQGDPVDDRCVAILAIFVQLFFLGAIFSYRKFASRFSQHFHSFKSVSRTRRQLLKLVKHFLTELAIGGIIRRNSDALRSVELQVLCDHD